MSTKPTTYSFPNLDGAVRRSVPSSSPDAVYRRLAEIEARDGIDEIRILGRWRAIHPPSPAIVAAILRGAK